MADQNSHVLGSMRVLYVEDDHDILLLMQRRIASLTQECLVARDGGEGLELFRQQKPDIVISDLQMPVMDGLALAETIKEESPGTPIILTTAHSDAEYLLKAIELGVDGYVVKPIKAAKLQATLEKCADALFMKREVERQHRELQQLYAEDREDQVVANAIWKKLLNENISLDSLIEVHVQPTREFSGDFIASARGKAGDLFIMLADVTGHGLQAALFLLPLSHQFYSCVKAGYAISDIARALNEIMHGVHIPGRFVATAIARIGDDGGDVEVWNGGIPDAIYVSQHGTHRFESRNFPLGIVRGEAFSGETEHVHCEQSGIFFMCSDGLTEAQNAEGKQFGLEQVEQALIAANPGKQHILLKFQQHMGDKVPHDDISFILVHCGGMAT